MNPSVKLIISVTLLSTCRESTVYGSNMIFKKFEMCNEPINTPIKIYFGIDNSNKNYSLMSGNVSYPEDLGDAFTIDINQEAKIKNKWIKLMHIREKNPCFAYKKYLGPAFTEFQRRANMMPGVCPLKKGKYKFENYKFNYNSIPIKFPFSELRTTVLVKKGNVVHSCTIILENII